MVDKAGDCCSTQQKACQTSCCGGSADNKIDSSATQGEKGEKLLIELLYIDLTTCDRCLGTEASLDEAIAMVTPLLASAGWLLEVKKILVETEEQARALRFVTSPTIRIDGQDIQLAFTESDCACCGEITGGTVDCRVWQWQGKEYTSPPAALIVDAIFRYVYGGQGRTTAISEPQEVPENLKQFFAAKKNLP